MPGFDTSAAAGVESAAMRRHMLAALDDEAAAAPGRAFPGTPPYDRDATLAAIAGGTGQAMRDLRGALPRARGA
ncbi:MAG: hypothetical protein U1F11_12025 [Steroidobacteraceae bacterium]